MGIKDLTPRFSWGVANLNRVAEVLVPGSALTALRERYGAYGFLLAKVHLERACQRLERRIPRGIAVMIEEMGEFRVREIEFRSCREIRLGFKNRKGERRLIEFEANTEEEWASGGLFAARDLKVEARRVDSESHCATVEAASGLDLGFDRDKVQLIGNTIRNEQVNGIAFTGGGSPIAVAIRAASRPVNGLGVVLHEGGEFPEPICVWRIELTVGHGPNIEKIVAIAPDCVDEVAE